MCKRKRLLSGLISLCLLLALFGGLSVSAETKQEEWFKSWPSSAVFDSLWVDDVVFFKSQYHDYGDDGPAPGNTLTIVSGDGVEIIDKHFGDGDCYKGLKFTKPGKAQVKIKETKKDTGASQEKTFSFTVTKRPADKPVKASYDSFGNRKVKIGERGDFICDINLDVTFSNANYGAAQYGKLKISSDDFHDFLDGGYGGLITPFVGENRTCDPLHADLRINDFSLLYAYKPGTEPISVSYEGWGNLGTLGTITVEEPVITTNAPTSVKVGGTLNLTTALTNTALKNMKTSEYENKENYRGSGLTIDGVEDGVEVDKIKWYKYYERNTNPVAYKPSVTVLEGKDCVIQSGQDYSNTLTSSETLTFKKAGTVKLKVTYTQLATSPELIYSHKIENNKQIWYPNDQRYSPEKIITIQVTEDGKPVQPPAGTTTSSNSTGKPSSVGSPSAPANSAPSSTSFGETNSTTGESTLPPVEEQPVVITDEETGIKLGAAEGVVPSDTALVVKPSNFVLEDAAGKFAAFDISLENGGAKIQPNGKVQVSIPVPAGYDKERLTIYHIADDGTKTELPCTVTGDAVTFETDHFSLYVLAEKAAVQTADDTPQPSKKGSSPVVWIVLVIVLIAAAGGFVLWWFKLRKKPEIDSEA